MTTPSAIANPSRRRLSAAFIAPRVWREAANDNGEPLHGHAALRGALLVFAEHGIGAAEVARQRAEQAWSAGEDSRFRHWLAVCRTLDRRMAARVLATVARSRV